MNVRRPNPVAAVIDVAFAVGAAICGAFGLGIHYAFGVVIAHGVFWAVSKQTSLRATPRNQLTATIAVSLALIAAVDFGAYYLATLFAPPDLGQ